MVVPTSDADAEAFWARAVAAPEWFKTLILAPGQARNSHPPPADRDGIDAPLRRRWKGRGGGRSGAPLICGVKRERMTFGVIRMGDEVAVAELNIPHAPTILQGGGSERIVRRMEGVVEPGFSEAKREACAFVRDDILKDCLFLHAQQPVRGGVAGLT
jgi:hypothetical protein